MVVRKIFKNATTSHESVRELLAFVFTQELLLPSRDIFLVAPWISNISILDNRQGGFMSLNPEWSWGDINLVSVLTDLASRGARLHLHVNTDSHNRFFESRLQEALSDAGVSDQCYWKVHKNLHTKGILTESVLISGSMNLTRNGIRILDESVEACFDPVLIAGARVHFDLYEND
jgi:hypothetical protein